jgi:membrane-associated phospholipid phosphatase
MRSEAGSIFWMGLQGFFLESGITDIVKLATERPRPYLYAEGEAILNKPIDKNGTKSFFSGHTSSTAYFTFFTAKVFSELHPDSKLKPFVWGMAAAMTGATGYFRYKAGRHFVTDIVVGGLFGAFMGILIPNIYQNKNLSLTASPGGIALAYQFK